MANIAPLLLGAGALYFIMRGKGDGSSEPDSAGFGSEAGGTSPCHLLTGIWSPAQPPSSSPLAEVTTSPKLVILPLTVDAFTKADQFFLSYHNSTDAPEQDIAVFEAEKLLTEGLGCDWTKEHTRTPRMKQVHNALVALYNAGVHPGA